MEERKEVKTYEVSLKCDKCGKDMKCENDVIMTYHPVYKYKCECGYTCESITLYPHIEYK